MAHRGGAERRPGEHDAGVRARRRRARLPLPRDRHPGHRRRRAARLPRRRPAAHVRIGRARSRRCRSATSRRLASTAPSRFPLLEDLLDDLAGGPVQHRLQVRRRRRAARRPAASPRLPRPGVHRRRSTTAGWLGCGRCSVRRAARRSPSGRRRCSSSPGRTTGGLAAQVPVRYGRVTVTDSTVRRRAHRRGIVVHVWTIDDGDEMIRLLDLGVDGIITDRPAELKQVLLEPRPVARVAPGRTGLRQTIGDVHDGVSAVDQRVEGAPDDDALARSPDGGERGDRTSRRPCRGPGAHRPDRRAPLRGRGSRCVPARTQRLPRDTRGRRPRATAGASSIIPSAASTRSTPSTPTSIASSSKRHGWPAS